MSRWTSEQIANPDFIDNIMKHGRPSGEVTLVLSDGNVKTTKREAIINIILWSPMFKLNIPPVVTDYMAVPKFNRTFPSKLLTVVYKRLIKDYPQIHYMTIIELMWVAINDLYKFTQVYCGSYNKSLSLLQLCKLTSNPEIKELRDRNITSPEGMEVTEHVFKQTSKELMELLTERGRLKDNCIIDFIESGNLKDNQIPQVLMSYGTRSDIDTTVFPSVIKGCAISGVRSVQDFAIEATSAKKSAFMNKLSIQDSQYMVRRMKLVCSPLLHVYEQVCDNTLTIPLLIQKDHKKNYIDKTIIVDDNEILLTSKNIDEFVNKTVDFVSPLTCKYTDGCCVKCAGRGNRDVHKFIPPNMHIGLLSATKVGEPVTQMILSTKHLTKTDCQTYAMPADMKMYFTQQSDNIFIKRDLQRTLDKASLRIPLGQIGILTDLTQDTLPSAETFSSMDEFEIIMDDKVLISISHKDAKFFPYLSEDMLVHLSKKLNQLDSDDSFISIPLKGFNCKKPFMSFIFIDDDMVAFTKQVDAFFKNKVSTYTSIVSALTDLTNLLYTKTKINLFFVEMVLRAYMISNEYDFNIPVVTDINNVMFQGEERVLRYRSVSTKLSYEQVARYLKTTDAYYTYKQPGLYDKLYGF